MSAVPGASQRQVCRLLGVPRSRLHPPTRVLSVASHPIGDAGSPVAGSPVAGSPVPFDLVGRVQALIAQHPTFGYRRIWAIVRFGDGIVVTQKTLYRLLKRRGWLVHQRPTRTARPRIQAKRSQVDTSNTRWAIDVTHIDCGRDGWGHLAAVIDCCDREIIGYEFALRGRANEAERAIEMAILARFGTLRPTGPLPIIRSDNGLIFQSHRFRAACRAMQLDQEFITPYTPEQNGLIERFFRSAKEECVWQHPFASFDEATPIIAEWIAWYNTGRPHQALGYRSPAQFRDQQQLQRVA